MDRKLFGIFSGWQITTIIGIAIIAPTALMAAATQSVFISSPSGNTANVDKNSRLSVYDPIAGYRNNPSYFKQIYISNHADACDSDCSYKVPSGKNLIVTSINGALYPSDTTRSSYIAVYDGPNCTSALISSQATNEIAASITLNSEPGVKVLSGKTVVVYSGNDNGYTFIQGYLVPANAPPQEVADAGPDGRPITASEVAQKRARMRR